MAELLTLIFFLSAIMTTTLPHTSFVKGFTLKIMDTEINGHHLNINKILLLEMMIF